MALGHAKIRNGDGNNNRSTDNSIQGLQNEGLGDITKSGYAEAIGDEVTSVGTLDAGVLIPIHNNLPVVTTSAETQTGKVKQSLKILNGNCIDGDATLFLRFDNTLDYDTIKIWTDDSGVLTANVITPDNSTDLPPLNKTGWVYLEIIKNDSQTVKIPFIEGEGSSVLDQYGVNGATLVNFVAQWGESDLSVPTLREGFATIAADNVLYPKVLNGAGYAGLTGAEPGFTAYLRNSFGATEHDYSLPDTWEARKLDQVENDGDSQYFFDVSYNQLEKDLSDILENRGDTDLIDISQDPIKRNYVMNCSQLVDPKLTNTKNKLNIS